MYPTHQYYRVILLLEGQQRLNLLNGLHSPVLCFIEDGWGLGPAGMHVGEVDREGGVSPGDSSLMTYQIQFAKPRLLLMPISKVRMGIWCLRPGV